MKDYFLWLQLIGTLASTVANQNGNAPAELKYLSMLAAAAREGTLTEAKVQEVDARYRQEKLIGHVPTDDELSALEQRLLANSAQIQVG